MEDIHPDIPPVTRASDKRVIRQAAYSFAFIAVLATMSVGAYFLGNHQANTKVLGTEIIVSPTPYPTLPPIPTLIPTPPGYKPLITITPKVIPIKPGLKLQAIPTNTPTPTLKPVLIIQKPIKNPQKISL
jgi:hypothetical protein